MQHLTAAGWRDVKGQTYLFTRHQAVCRRLTHSVDTDRGDAQHRRDGHHHHLWTHTVEEKEEAMKNLKAKSKSCVYFLSLNSTGAALQY